MCGHTYSVPATALCLSLSTRGLRSRAEKAARPGESMTLLGKRGRPPQPLDSGGVPRPNIAPGRRVVVLCAGVLALAALALVFARAFSRRGTGRHVVMISVDGMGSSYYMQPGAGLKIPNIRRLMAGGS